MRHVHFRPTDMFKTKQVPAEKVVDALQVPPAMTRGDTGDTNSTFDVIDQESADGMMETEVEEVILVRKLGAVASLRARRTAVLRQLEVVSLPEVTWLTVQAHVKMAQRVLAAVASYQKKNGYPTETYTPLRPVHDMDAGLDALNGPRDEHLPGLSKDERLNRLTAALGNYVGDAPEQCGEGENTVWDVSYRLEIWVQLTPAGLTCSASWPLEPVPRPDPPQSHLILPESECASDRLPHNKAQLPLAPS